MKPRPVNATKQVGTREWSDIVGCFTELQLVGSSEKQLAGEASAHTLQLCVCCGQRHFYCRDRTGSGWTAGRSPFPVLLNNVK